ncbi:MAG: hypothetical protein QGG73_08580 [Candidatus Hydrogenedentes bacterium]|nr:hypothetical protein [Candidatus Hydrogenedentota bacterium]
MVRLRPRAAFFLVAFFGTNSVMGFVHIKGGFLRLDWIAFLVIAAYLLKMERFKLVGFVMAYPTMARISPAIFIADLGGKLVWNTINQRKLNRRYIGFFVAVALGAALLFGGSLGTTGGLYRVTVGKEGVSDAAYLPLTIQRRARQDSTHRLPCP